MAAKAKKTTMAKLSRENRQREKRAEKAARRDQRKREGAVEPDADSAAEPIEEAWQLTRGLDQLD